MQQHYFDVPFAFSGDVTAIPDPLQVGGTVSFTEGWNFNYQRDLTTDPAALPIDRSTMNWLFLQITTALQALQNTGVPEWITAANNGGTAKSYGKGSVVLYSAAGTPPFVKYVSLIDSNTVTPGTDATKWQVVADAIATAAQASAGTDNTTIMTPVRVATQDALRALLAGSASQVFNVAPGSGTQAAQFQQVQALAGSMQSVALIASGTLTAAQMAGSEIFSVSASPVAYTLASRASVIALTPNSETTFTNSGSSTVTITCAAGDTITTTSGNVTSIVMQPGDDLTIMPRSSANQWIATMGSTLRQFNPLTVANATGSQQALPLGQAVGRLLNVQVFTASGTYTQTPGTKSQIVQAIGGGGSGSGTPATGASQVAVGGPGGSGAYAEVYFSTPIASGTAVTIGAGGTQVNGGSNPGATTSVGTNVVCPGGRGGSTAGPTTAPVLTGSGAGALGTATQSGGVPLVLTQGNSGGLSFAMGTGTTAIGGAPGADGQWGGGGVVTAGNTPGNAGTAPGAGGSGTATNPSQASIAGGPGKAGIVIIYEFGTV